jgi:tetratricopeptide (TPR) repeat protein
MFVSKQAAALWIGSLLLLSGCSTTPELDQLRQSGEWQKFPRTELSQVPFFPQKQYQCGPAALATLLNWSAVPITPDDLVPLVYVPERHGSFQAEMVAATRHYGRIPYVIDPGMRPLIHELNAGNPVLAFQNLGLSWLPQWHYAVVTGVDPQNNQVILRSGTTQRHVVSVETFARTWRRADRWAMVVTKPGDIPATANPLSYVKAVSYFEQKGQLNIARKSYQAAVTRWPASLPAIMGLGNVYYHSGELLQARQSYQQALEVADDYAPAHNNLAQVLLEQGDLQSAHRHAMTAVNLGGKHLSNYQETLAAIEQRLAMQPHAP